MHYMCQQRDFERMESGLATPYITWVFRNFIYYLKEPVVPIILMISLFSPWSSVLN
jgi:hypothetical protein